MAYTVNKFDGTFLTTVADGTIDSTTDIRFVGKNYAGYGEIQNENFLHLMENFANTTPPPRKLVGQIWFDTTSTEKKLKFWDGTTWRVASGAAVSTIAPSGSVAGDFWWDSAKQQLNIYNGTDFVLIGPPENPEFNRLETRTVTVKDTTFTRTIVLIKTNGQTVAIFSSYETFIPQEVIEGFPTIYKGITLPGVSAGVSTSFKFNGTATNADRLGGILATEFTNLLQGNFTGDTHFSNSGYTLGDLNNLAVKYDTTEEKLLFVNQLNQPLYFRIGSNDIASVSNTGIYPGINNTYDIGSSVNRWKSIYATTITADSKFVGRLEDGDKGIDSTGGITGNILRRPSGNILVDVVGNRVGDLDGTTRIIGRFEGTFSGNLTDGFAEKAASLVSGSEIYPPSKNFDEPTSTVNILGNTAVIRTSLGDIHARNFIASGAANRANTLSFDGSFFGASSIVPGTAEKRSIVARDSAGDIEARLFRGTATAARYADLAEKYLPDAEYDVGTVVAVGGEAEVTAAQWGDRAIGVVSANPAFMMNKDLEGGIYIALKGRVPVKVTGAVKKGQRLVASNNGVAIPAVPHANDVFAIALESNDDTGVKLIEAVIL